MKSQVTTKRGDSGVTTALSGEHLPKSHIVMECVGTVDELRAQTALARLRLIEAEREDSAELAETLIWVLHTYFLIGSQCSDPLNEHPEYRMGEISSAHLERIETEQQRLEERTPLPHAFIASASTTVSAQIDIACTVARRLERNIVRLKEACPAFREEDILRYINRLSDFLFILARYVEDGAHHTVDYMRFLT